MSKPAVLGGILMLAGFFCCKMDENADIIDKVKFHIYRVLFLGL